jgi:hypothetical protein
MNYLHIPRNRRTTLMEVFAAITPTPGASTFVDFIATIDNSKEKFFERRALDLHFLSAPM